MSLQKLTNLAYETLPDPPYSLYFSPTTTFPNILMIFQAKTFHCKDDSVTPFKDLLMFKALHFYHKGINNLVT